MKELFVVSLLLLAACSSAPSLAPGQTPGPPGSVSQACADALEDLTDALFELDSRLNVGMVFAAYSEKVADARVAYDRLKPAELDADCLRGVGSPAEDVMNEYIKAYSTWNDCITKTGCTNDSIMSELQAHWAKATSTLAEIKKRLP